MDEIGFYECLAILKRRKKYFIFTTLAVFLLSFMFALKWSNYRATATVEVAQPEISDNMTTPMGMNAGNMLEALADFRISRLQQKVTTVSSLVDIITKFNLYPEDRKYRPVAEIAEKMRKKIRLNLISGSLANPASAQKASAMQLSAIAFELSFDYGNPMLAQQVTNELVSRFLDEDIKERREQTKETSSFLDVQIKTVEASLAEQEKNIADFKSANGDIRPEALAFNQQAAASTLMNLQNLESQITSNLGAQGAIRAQLAATDPYSRVIADGQLLTTPSAQLKALQSEQATLSAKYGPSHPDVVKVNRQIASLESTLGVGNAIPSLKAKIIDTETTLATSLKSLGENHPDVVAQKNQLSKLKAQLKELQSKPRGTSSLKRDADNPAYLQLVAQLESTEEQYKALQEQKASVQQQLEKYQNAVAENPATEQKLAELTRDYTNTQMRFRDLKAKKMAADLDEAVEQGRSGQHLVVLNPPELPTSTYPARMLFIIAGILFSVICGLASVLAAQFISGSIIGARQLEALAGVAPMISIPHMVTEDEKHAIDSLKLRSVITAIALAILAMIIFSYTVMPLDVFWFVGSRKLGIY